MQQRQLRLGDILDDYCPRERRITNHAVVAMVGADVKQTRCTTCEAEHEYKQAKVPASRRKKEAPAAPFDDVAAGAPEPLAAAAPVRRAAAERARVPRRETKPAASAPASAAVPEPLPEPEAQVAAGVAPSPPEEPGAPVTPDATEATEVPAAPAETDEDEGPVHRRLIRATLPRQEGQVVRPAPQFTIRQPAGRPAGFGGGKGRSGGRPHGGGGGRAPAGGGGKGRAAFSRGGADGFGRGRGRESQLPQRHARHSQAGHPLRPGKKHSK